MVTETGGERQGALYLNKALSGHLGNRLVPSMSAEKMEVATRSRNKDYRLWL